MRKVVLNGTEIEVEVDGNGLFSDLKEALKEELDAKSRVITSVKDSGTEVFQNNIDGCLGRPLSTFGSISITAESLDEISTRLFRNGIAFLSKLKEEVLRVSESFRLRSKEEAFHQFVSYVDGLQSIFELIDVLIKNPRIDFLGSVYGGRTGEVIIKEFTGLNKEVLRAQEGEDTILLADLLEYELAPSLDNLSGLLGVVSESTRRT